MSPCSHIYHNFKRAKKQKKIMYIFLMMAKKKVHIKLWHLKLGPRVGSCNFEVRKSWLLERIALIETKYISLGQSK